MTNTARLLGLLLVSISFHTMALPQANQEPLLPHLKLLLEDPNQHVRREAGFKIERMEEDNQKK